MALQLFFKYFADEFDNEPEVESYRSQVREGQVHNRLALSCNMTFNIIKVLED